MIITAVYRKFVAFHQLSMSKGFFLFSRQIARIQKRITTATKKKKWRNNKTSSVFAFRLNHCFRIQSLLYTIRINNVSTETFFVYRTFGMHANWNVFHGRRFFIVLFYFHTHFHVFILLRSSVLGKCLLTSNFLIYYNIL